MDLSTRRVLNALAIFIVVIHIGAVGIYLLGDGEYTIQECVYFSIITISTVGYGELPHLEAHPLARVYTGAYIITGIGTLAYFQSTVTALLIEGVIGRVWRRRRMQRQIKNMSGHLVVAGCGRTGKYIVEELSATGREFVVIDRDLDLLEALAVELGGNVLYIVGDATEDHTLLDAGVKRAGGVIAALSDDKDNLFVTLSARTLNPDARIVSKAVDIENEPKLLRAGADKTVSPNRIGGHRLVSELVRPKVTRFLDNMLRVTENLWFEEVAIPEDSKWTGRALGDLPIRDRTNLLVIALHQPDGSYVYNPSSDLPLASGVQLIVMGELAGVEKLREMISDLGG